MENTYAVLYGINDLRLENHPVPELKDTEVLIRIKKSGICGTDLSLVYNGRKGDLFAKFPAGVGHESSGEIVKCGKKVTNLKIGDRVTIEPGSFCRECDYCLAGKYNVCDKNNFHNGSLFPGTIARYFKYEAHLAHKLPDTVSDEEGAIVEPMAVALHACRRSGVTAGTNLMITGSGPIGLLTLLNAKAMGATNILVTDIKESRVAMAKRLGADHTLLVGSGDAQSLAKEVKKIMGCMPDITIECSGTQSGLTLGIYATKARGKLLLAGLGAPEVKVPLVHAAVREIDIMGLYRYVQCFPIVIDMLAKKMVDVKPLITHRFEFKDFKKAFEVFRNAEDGAIKCMIASCE